MNGILDRRRVFARVLDRAGDEEMSIGCWGQGQALSSRIGRIQSSFDESFSIGMAKILAIRLDVCKCARSQSAEDGQVATHM